MVDSLRVSGEWKIHLTMKINFILSKNRGKSQPMDSKSDKRNYM